MSLLDKASLVVTPNAYKESKLYSVIPSDGSGDMIVVRATTATRINSANLVEEVPRNILTYSEQFDNADWNKINATITANTTIAPNGTTTADTLVITSGGYLVRPIMSFSAVTGQKMTASIFTKNQITDFLQFGGATPAGTDVYSIETISNGWYRHKVTRTFTTTAVGTLQFIIYDRVGSNFIWGAQLEIGSTATEYFPTTTRLNIPRIDYTNGSCPSLLVEPQRTNLLTYSEQFDNVIWLKQNATVTANTTTSPSGVSNADSLIASNGTANFKGLYTAQGSAAPKSFSFFAKKGNKDWAILLGYNGDNNCWFNVSNGTIGTIGSNYTNAKIENFGNGWYRCSATLNTSISGTNLGIYVSNADNSTSCTGDGTTPSLYIWGTQCEAGAYATSYIPTIASAVTRNMDIISKTGISSLIGQTEGTLFGEFKLETVNSGSAYFAITSGSFTNFILFGKEAGVTPNKLALGIRANGTNIIFDTSTSLTSNYVKCAIAYKSGDWAIYLNGSLAFSGSNTFTFSSALNSFGFTTTGDFTSMNEKIEVRSGQIYKTRLSNTELAQLTTL